MKAKQDNMEKYDEIRLNPFQFPSLSWSPRTSSCLYIPQLRPALLANGDNPSLCSREITCLRLQPAIQDVSPKASNEHTHTHPCYVPISIHPTLPSAFTWQTSMQLKFFQITASWSFLFAKSKFPARPKLRAQMLNSRFNGRAQSNAADKWHFPGKQSSYW